MSQTKRSFGIFHKILLAMLLVALVPMGIIWFLDFQSANAENERHVREQLSAYADGLTRQVDSWVDMNRRMLLQNASLEDMRTMRSGQQVALLKNIIDNYEWNYLAFTTDVSGNNISRSDGKSLKYYGDRQYIQQVVDGAELGKQVLIGKSSGVPALVLSTPIFNDNKQLTGVLATAMTINDISNTVTAARIGKTGFAFLLDEKGQVVSHPSEEYTRVRKDLSTHPAFVALNQQSQRSTVFEDESGKKVIAYMTRTAQGWTMVAQQDYAEVYQSITAGQRNALILLVVTLLVVVAIALVIARGLSRPILNLTKMTEALSKGNLNVTIQEVSRKDEIGALAQGVERLGTSIRYAMERLKKSKATGTSAG